MLICEVTVLKMFSAYAEDMGYPDNLGRGYKLHHYQYFCKKCNQSFAAAWDALSGFNYRYYERGKTFHCPYCGELHEKYVAYIGGQEMAPVKVRLAVTSFKNSVKLEVKSDVVIFNGMMNVYEEKYTETFCFDITNQTTTFKSSRQVEIDLGNPFKLDVFKHSLLKFFQANCLGNEKQKKELNKVLRALRSEVQKKIEEKLGHKINSMFVSAGQIRGMFMVPIFNMAFRLRFPDAQNLPSAYRFDARFITEYWRMCMLKDHGFVDRIAELTKKKIDFTKAIVDAVGLPNKTAVRRELDSNIFKAGKLAAAFSICKNYDLAMRSHEALKNVSLNRYQTDSELFSFLRSMRTIYGEAGMPLLLENAWAFNLGDCIRLYQQLNEENRKALKVEKVKPKELHDWMAKKHRRQSFVNKTFEVPEHIINRLSMQTDRLKFFLPKESLELLAAGEELHNCVATYSHDMAVNEKHIVLVADDGGKLAACLEINGKNLVQAKLNGNKPVSDDEKLNTEIIAWAKEAGLEVKTLDVNLPKKKLVAAVC